MNTDIKTIDDFISTYPEPVRVILEEIRSVIRAAAPEAEEKISYGIPTFTFHGNLVHFSAYEKHIGFYPGSGAIVAFAKELEPYDTSKGTVRFPLDKPIPMDFIKKITEYRVEQALAK